MKNFYLFLNRGASIINLSSVIAFRSTPTTAIYSASKAALNAYMRTAALELAKKNIRINAVNPGPVETPIFKKTGMPEAMLNGYMQTMKNQIPLKRFGKPEEIAKLVAFLASDDAALLPAVNTVLMVVLVCKCFSVYTSSLKLIWHCTVRVQMTPQREKRRGILEWITLKLMADI